MSLKEKFYCRVALFLLKPRFKSDLPFNQYLKSKGDNFAELLFAYAQKKPYFHLKGYMHRWWIMRHPQRPGDKDYATGAWARFRNGLRYLYPFYARFHFIMRPDDRDPPHNHPFGFTSIILAGWYEEDVLQEDGSMLTYRYNPGDVNVKTADSYHRITAVAPEGVLTLVIMGRRTGDSWGFKVGDQHIPWNLFLGVERMEEVDGGHKDGFFYLDQAIALLTLSLIVSVVAIATTVVYAALRGA